MRLPILRLLSFMLLLAPALPEAARAEPPGVLAGSLSYPSDFIPPDMAICAENLVTRQRYCTRRHLKGAQYTYKAGYRLEVPPGDYVVYAYLPDPGKYGATYPPDYRAYYSEFVKCGMRAECPSHAPIVVKVRSCASLQGIDPQDWYR